MKIVLRIFGWLLIGAGVAWAIFIVTAVAAQKEGFTTIVELIPGLVFHTLTMLASFSLLGLSQRERKPAGMPV